MKQIFKEVVSEGIEKAKADSAKRIPQKKKSEADFGVMAGLEDPYKFMKPKEKTKLKGKKNE